MAEVSPFHRRYPSKVTSIFVVWPESRETGTDHRNGVSFDQQDGSALGGWTGHDAIGAYAGVARHVAKSAESISNQEFGVAKLGTYGPARRSRLLSPAWRTGPPPIPRRGPPW